MVADTSCNSSAQAQRHLIDGGAFNAIGASGGAGCNSRVEFDVPMEMTYTLNASATGDAIATYALSGVANGSTTGSSGPHSGTLEPGFYVLTATSNSTAGAFGGAPNDYSESESSQVSCTLTLTPSSLKAAATGVARQSRSLWRSNQTIASRRSQERGRCANMSRTQAALSPPLGCRAVSAIQIGWSPSRVRRS